MRPLSCLAVLGLALTACDDHGAGGSGEPSDAAAPGDGAHHPDSGPPGDAGDASSPRPDAAVDAARDATPRLSDAEAPAIDGAVTLPELEAQCASDEDCPAAAYCDTTSWACRAGCRAGACGPRDVCDDKLRYCVPRVCATDEDCPADDTFCDATRADATYRCLPGCRGDADCGDGRYCHANGCRDRCGVDADCAPSGLCEVATGYCHDEGCEPFVTDCGPGRVCDPVQSACVPARCQPRTDDCGDGMRCRTDTFTCVENVCDPLADDCGDGARCDAVALHCVEDRCDPRVDRCDDGFVCDAIAFTCVEDRCDARQVDACGFGAACDEVLGRCLDDRQPCEDDLHEPDDDAPWARRLVSDQFDEDGRICPGNEDWFVVTLARDDGLLVELAWTGGATFRLELFAGADLAGGIVRPRYVAEAPFEAEGRRILAVERSPGVGAFTDDQWYVRVAGARRRDTADYELTGERRRVRFACPAADGPCPPGNACANAGCDAEGRCALIPVPDGASCVDDDVCNGAESCVAGVCRPGTPPDCPEDVCNDATCLPTVGCVLVPRPDGTACVNDNVCDGAESCRGGECVAERPPLCPGAGVCSVPACDPVQGCWHMALNDGTPCDDGNLCNGREVCQEGACVPGQASACPDPGPCHDVACDPTLGCVVSPRPDGSSCGNGDACDGEELCEAGVCRGGAPPECDLGDKCRVASCDRERGCVYANLEDGVSCDDGDACNGEEVCADGECASGEPLVCAPWPCAAMSCRPDTGCVAEPFADGTPCDDGDLCNGREVCGGGQCMRSAPEACAPRHACETAACDPVRGCVRVDVADGVSCEDGDLCNGSEVCRAGACVAGLPPFCEATDPCLVGRCDPALGCVSEPAPAGTPCDDQTVCNGRETCEEGRCLPGTPPECGADDACTTVGCDADGGCFRREKPDGLPCDDGTVCNGREVCAVGECVPGPALDCGDEDACSAPGCDPEGGCLREAVREGQPCDDANLCNGREFCAAGVCRGNPPPDCGVPDACTVVGCDAGGGCFRAPRPDGTDCSDGDPCNGEETCGGGACRAGEPLDCGVADACTVPACDAEHGGCHRLARADGTACADGTVCNGAETCRGGTCVPGAAPECGVEDACTVPVCDPVTGCGRAPKVDGTSCTDGDACNGAETCRAGRCEPGPAPSCGVEDACSVPMCDRERGCVRVPRPDGTSCGDGTVCNGAETCQAGVCAPGTPLACGGDEACTVAACDPTGGCYRAPRPDGTSCSDDDPCNGAEACQSGQCRRVAPPPVCAGDACNDGFCETGRGCTTRPRADGTTCGDSNVCNGVEVCRAGACQPGAAPNCGAEDACTRPACDPTGGCFRAPKPDGTACSDGDVCNGQETCGGGVCRAGAALQCGAEDACTVPHCDRVNGCSRRAKPDQTDCGDGNPCNGSERCLGGQCRTLIAAPLCGTPNPCEEAFCQDFVGCRTRPRPNGTSCGNGQFCDGDEVCSGGQCTPGHPRACPAGNQCQVGGCDEGQDRCVISPRGAGTPCDDGDLCTGSDVCDGGGGCRGRYSEQYPPYPGDDVQVSDANNARDGRPGGDDPDLDGPGFDGRGDRWVCGDYAPPRGDPPMGVEVQDRNRHVFSFCTPHPRAVQLELVMRANGRGCEARCGGCPSDGAAVCGCQSRERFAIVDEFNGAENRLYLTPDPNEQRDPECPNPGYTAGTYRFHWLAEPGNHRIMVGHFQHNRRGEAAAPCSTNNHQSVELRRIRTLPP